MRTSFFCRGENCATVLGSFRQDGVTSTAVEGSGFQGGFVFGTGKCKRKECRQLYFRIYRCPIIFVVVVCRKMGELLAEVPACRSSSRELQRETEKAKTVDGLLVCLLPC